MPHPAGRRSSASPRSWGALLFSSPVLFWSGLWLVVMFFTVAATLSLLKSDLQLRRAAPQPLAPAASDWQTAAGFKTAANDDQFGVGVSVPTDGLRPAETLPLRSPWPLPPWLALAIAALSATAFLAVTLLLRKTSRRRRVKRLPPAPARRSLPPARTPQFPQAVSPAHAEVTSRQEAIATAPAPAVGSVVPLFPSRSASLADELDLRKRYSLTTLIQDDPR